MLLGSSVALICRGKSSFQKGMDMCHMVLWRLTKVSGDILGLVCDQISRRHASISIL